MMHRIAARTPWGIVDSQYSEILRVSNEKHPRSMDTHIHPLQPLPNR